MVKLTEVIKDVGYIRFREIFINPEHVVYLREDSITRKFFAESQNHDFDPNQTFTKLVVRNGSGGSEFVVVGEPTLIESRLKGKTLLNG
jgi:hypothetical protein